jgi:hypothetical protein
MDFTQLQSQFDQLSDDEIGAAGDELHAFVAHRRSKVRKGAQAAPFNAANFFANLIKILQALQPIIGPLLGEAPKKGQTPAGK